MHRIGFSTGALARGDFRAALRELRRHRIEVVELSALRAEELLPLTAAIPQLDLADFSFVSIHAPSRFPVADEQGVVERLRDLAGQGFAVVVHPDVISTFGLWARLGEHLLIENMDKRKPVGRTVRELEVFFENLPAARFCFDIGHVRQIDPSMSEATLLLEAFGSRLAEIHISEVNTASRHDPISMNAVRAFQGVLAEVPEEVPVIIESLIDQGQSSLEAEMERAAKAMSRLAECVALGI
jgi:hypothetical protein